MVPAGLLPISAVLGLGGIAGAKRQDMMDAERRRLEAQSIAQQNQQNIANQMAADQQLRQQQAQQQSSQIQTALAYDQLNQKNAMNQQQLGQQQAEQQAQQLFKQTQGQEQTRQFNERQALDEQQFATKQAGSAEQEQAVNQMIDQLAPAGTEENMRLKLQFKATGKLPAPQQEDSSAHTLNVLVVARKMFIDPLGDALPGKEADLARIDQQINSLVGSMGGQNVLGQVPTTSNPLQPQGQGRWAVNPQTKERVFVLQR